MALNFLDLLAQGAAALGPVGGNRAAPQPIPQIDPGASAYAPRQTFDEAFADFPAPSVQSAGDPEVNNILASLGSQPVAQPVSSADVAGATAGVKAPANIEARSPRERASLLDIIGGIADSVASVGGAQPLYRMNLDAATERERAINLDAMRRQQFEMQQRQGEQGLQAGELEIADTERARLADVVAAAAGSDDPAAVFGTLAQQAGIPPDKAAAIGQALQANPEMAGALAQSLGFRAPSQGSQAKELQVYQLLAENDPDAAAAYLQNLSDPNSLTPYQQAQLGISMAGLGLRQDQFAEGVRQFDVKQEAAGSGGANLTPTQRGNVQQKLKALPTITTQLARVKELAIEMEQNGTFARGAVAGLLPGQVAGGNAETFDRATDLLRQQMRQLLRTPGEGSMSDYETRLASATIPSRWGSDEARAESIRNLEVLIGGLQTGYADMLGTPAPKAERSARSGAAPSRAPVDPERARRAAAIAAERKRRGL